MKKSISTFALLILLLLSACDREFEVTNIEIVNYPATIVYYIGHDSELDLSGGLVKLTDRRGENHFVEMPELINIFHSVDFNQEGVYVVELRVSEKVSCKFPIQVVEDNSDD